MKWLDFNFSYTNFLYGVWICHKAAYKELICQSNLFVFLLTLPLWTGWAKGSCIARTRLGNSLSVPTCNAYYWWAGVWPCQGLKNIPRVVFSVHIWHPPDTKLRSSIACFLANFLDTGKCSTVWAKYVLWLVLLCLTLCQKLSSMSSRQYSHYYLGIFRVKIKHFNEL